LLRAALTGREAFVLDSHVPPLEGRFENMDGLGLYLHIPFCRQICPYCPYNKEIYRPEKARRYARAVMREIDSYARLMGDVPVTSFYIGGGTPTTMLSTGLEELLVHIYRSFNMACGIHMESHPNDLTYSGLKKIACLGVAHLSIGVEALQDRHLRALKRPYTAEEAKAAVSRATGMGFKCVNTDFMFALPGQAVEEAEQTAQELIELGVDQVAAYPLFTFPYTDWSVMEREPHISPPDIFRRRKMIGRIAGTFHNAGFDRTSVWAFTRPGAPRYCSVTVPRYLGLGAGGGSYLDDVLFFNTFDVDEYIAVMEKDRSPVALSMALSRRMQMAGWLYWRIYETRFRKSEFEKRFGDEFDRVFGKFTRIFAFAGLLNDRDGEIVLNERGAFWLHAMQDLFSIDYVSRLWGMSKHDPWPEAVVL
jgi:coproporphyrinogen III oxidase-like Fe-S oxidoreductase